MKLYSAGRYGLHATQFQAATWRLEEYKMNVWIVNNDYVALLRYGYSRISGKSCEILNAEFIIWILVLLKFATPYLKKTFTRN
jgi:hypothetical protein